MKLKSTLLATAIIAVFSTVPSYGANFSDIANVPWSGAETYINSVADLKLMVGSENEKGQTVFRANEQVTGCETVQIVYNILKSTNQLKATDSYTEKWKQVMSGYHIPEWAYESTAYCLENNILSINDISKFMKDSTSSNAITREEVAVIVGKSLSSSNTINSAATLTYKDVSTISTASVPYIDLLSRLNIMVGDADNNFNPKNKINRAEMAVITDKTYKVYNNAANTPAEIQQFTGVVTNVENFGSSQMISVLFNGVSRGFIGDDTVSVVNGTQTQKFSSISKGDNITVDYEGTKINKITVNTAAAPSTQSIEGEIYEVTGLDIVISQSSSTIAYDFEPDCEVTIDGTSSTLKQLVDAWEDKTVTAKLTLNADKKVVTVTATTSANKLEGEVTYLSKDEITIEVGSSRTKSYDLIDDEEDITVKIDDKTKDFEDLMKAYDDDDTINVVLTLNNHDEVEKIVATTKSSSSSKDDNGELTFASESKIKVGGTTYKIEDEDDVTIKVTDGNRDITDLDDLIEAIDDGKVIEVDVTLDDDEVTKIKGEVTEVTGDLVSISSSKIKIKTDSGEYTYSFDEDDVDIDIDGDSADVDELNDVLNDEDVEVEVIIKDGEVTDINAET